MSKIYGILLFVAVVLTGCTREYHCCPAYYTESEVCSGPIYTVDWPNGEKEAEEQCAEDFPPTMGYDENGEPTGIVQGCVCDKAN